MEKLLKKIVILHAVALALAPLASIYSAMGGQSAGDSATNLVDIVVIIFSILYVLCLYWVFKLKPLGKTLYFPLLCFSIALIFVLPIEFFAHKTHLTVFIFDIINITAGIIVSLIHFTELKSKFVK
tara:strand:+ start:119 stop:496 length:378 start_codon:yes stop_codon:yes gene_type:complete